MQGTKQGELEANAQGPKLAIGLQARVLKGTIRGEGGRVCKQLMLLLLTGQW